MNSTEVYIATAQVIFHWWNMIAVSFVLLGLVPVFFYTQHQGVWYRLAFLTLLALLGTYVYALALDRTVRPPTLPDAMLPMVFTAWNFLVWVRSNTLIRVSHWHRNKLRITYLRELVNSVQVLPYLQTIQFAERLERWQKWFYAMIFMGFASGMLYHNVANVEDVLWAYLKSSQATEKQQQVASKSRDRLERKVDKVEKKVDSFTTTPNSNSATRPVQKVVVVKPVVIYTRPAPLIITQPAPKPAQLPTNFQLPGEVKPVPPQIRKGRKQVNNRESEIGSDSILVSRKY